jgi:adenylate cyclase
MGSQKRFNYSAMGDVVNVAARIESTTKNFRTDLLVSQDMLNATSGIALLEAGEIMLKGKSNLTKLYAVAGDEMMAATIEFEELARLHRWLLQAIASGDAKAAAAAIAACRPLARPELQGLYDHFAGEVAMLAAVKPSGRGRIDATAPFDGAE